MEKESLFRAFDADRMAIHVVCIQRWSLTDYYTLLSRDDYFFFNSHYASFSAARRRRRRERTDLIQPTRYTCWPRFVRDRTPRYRGHYSS